MSEFRDGVSARFVVGLAYALLSLGMWYSLGVGIGAGVGMVAR